MTQVLRPVRRHFSGPDGVRLVADIWGDGPPVVLLHGGGQTRHSWEATARTLASAGRSALTLDFRGHGDSDWAPDGSYELRTHVHDLTAICAALDEKPALVGASMGGITALLAAGDSPDGGSSLATSLVLVDITPNMAPAGVARIRDFMLSAPEGFASLDEAAEAVAAYRGHRPRATGGLAKNLRRGEDGRYRWHWDPRILTAIPDTINNKHEIDRAAARVRIPTRLIRGSQSDVVSGDGVRELLELMPTAEVTEIADAGHMVAGVGNDSFTSAIVEFVQRH